MRRLPLWLIALPLFAFGAAAALAATINGTSGNDTLRGTAKADRIFGKGGNDKLYGLGGNDYLNGGPGNDVLSGGPGDDRLVGGPGSDRFVCGPGRDTVSGDLRDTAASDCEVVKGLRKPPPVLPIVPAGRYCGFTDQGQSICFTIDPTGRSFSSAHFGATPVCRPPEPQWVFTIDFGGEVAIRASGAFAYDVGTGDLVGSYVHGTIDPGGAAAGTMHLVAHSFDDTSGQHFDCDSVDTTWQAKLQQ